MQKIDAIKSLAFVTARELYKENQENVESKVSVVLVNEYDIDREVAEQYAKEAVEEWTEIYDG